MLQVQVTIKGDREMIAKLKKLDGGLTDFSDALGDIGNELKSYYSGQVFSSRGGVFGDPWASLNSAYKRRKTKLYRGTGILEASGKMRKSFKAKHGKNSLTISNTSKQFVYHQSSEPRTIMPRRQMLGVNNDVRTIVRQEIDSDIKRKLARL